VPVGTPVCPCRSGLTNDSAGVAIGWVSGFVKVPRMDMHEILPVVELDLVVEVKPPRNDEISFESIRRLFYRLRDDAGMNLKWISYDTFQSRDSVQILRQKNFASDLVSMDKSPIPYEVTKTAFYDGRINAPAHPKAVREFSELERDPQTGKIDHRPRGSKDLADAIAGVVYGLTYRREIWLRHHIPLTEIPASLNRPKEIVQDDSGLRPGDHDTSEIEIRSA
jgi:hypothetical protein